MQSATDTGSRIRSRCAVRADGAARDVYITVLPAETGAPPEAAWEALASLLAEQGAALMEERVFAAPEALDDLRRARARPMAAFEDGVPPTWLAPPPSARGAFAGLIAHAVAGGRPPTPLAADGQPAGRRWDWKGYTLLTASPPRGAPAALGREARARFDAAAALLASAGADLGQLSRTWIWLRDIHNGYGELNAARNEVFRARGLLQSGGAGRLPASTGIGIAPADGSGCALDIAADLGAPGGPIERSSRQNPAARYGSAFSRGWIARTPFGRKVYVSGTASIGPDGRTLHEGDARAQIAETLRCVRAVLAAAGASEAHIVQALAYCKTPEVERLALEEFARPYPLLTAIADVCRPELLFEMECIAVAP